MLAHHLGAAFLGASLLVTVLVDIVNIYGVKYWMVENLTIPYFWFYWFSTPVENPLQWYLLGVTLIVFGMNAGRAYQRADHNVVRAYQDNDREAGPFWLLLTAGTMLMLVEESLELLGVAALLTAGLFYYARYRGQGTYGQVPPSGNKPAPSMKEP